jgi:hypothetical protein
MPGVFPDYQAPIVRNWIDGRELATVSSTESGMVSPSVGVHLKKRRQLELQGDIENGGTNWIGKSIHSVAISGLHFRKCPFTVLRIWRDKLLCGLCH